MCRWVFGVEIGRLPFILYFCAEKMNDMAENDVEQLLAGIEYPDDLRRLTPDKLEQVCAELRQYIIDVLSENPGHFGASLGTVELTVALHLFSIRLMTGSYGTWGIKPMDIKS